MMQQAMMNSDFEQGELIMIQYIFLVHSGPPSYLIPNCTVTCSIALLLSAIHFSTHNMPSSRRYAKITSSLTSKWVSLFT
jgi:hypothetical protein